MFSFFFQALCTEDYDRFSPTKQNLLCNGQSALESILSNQDFLQSAINNPQGNKTLELGIQVPPPRFAYALAKKTLSIILVLDLRYVLVTSYIPAIITDVNLVQCKIIDFCLIFFGNLCAVKDNSSREILVWFIFSSCKEVWKFTVAIM